MRSTHHMHHFAQGGDNPRFHHEPGDDSHGHGHGRGFGGPGFGPGDGFGFGPGFGRGFGPRGPRRANRGDVRAAILSLLAEGPSSGYGLIKAIAEKTGGSWRPSPGSVYPTLAQLVDEELIEAEGDSRRTDYQLSDAGREYVADNADELARAWESNPKPSKAGLELFESIGKLMGVVGQFRHSVSDEQRAAAVEKIDEARRALYLILAE